jgi:hypothetical protein
MSQTLVLEENDEHQHLVQINESGHEVEFVGKSAYPLSSKCVRAKYPIDLEKMEEVYFTLTLLNITVGGIVSIGFVDEDVDVKIRKNKSPGLFKKIPQEVNIFLINFFFGAGWGLYFFSIGYSSHLGSLLMNNARIKGFETFTQKNDLVGFGLKYTQDGKPYVFIKEKTGNFYGKHHYT